VSDFDKEAERERLREKYEREQEKRESTERMSELLLKGATMTDTHCGECGDPVFRYDGDEFCPTCQRMVEAGDGAGAADEGTGPEGDDATAEADADVRSEDATRSPADIEVKEPTGPTPTDANGAEGATQADTGTQADATSDVGAEMRAGEADAGAATDRTAETAGEPGGTAANADATGGTGQSVPSVRPSSGSGGDPVTAARESLRRTLLTHAREAEASEDPGQARDHLAAAREAAETLDALSSS
jgi:uncharacterized Zn finger protein (UPF0148 family)